MWETEEISDSGGDLWSVRKHQLCYALVMWLLQFAWLERSVHLWPLITFDSAPLSPVLLINQCHGYTSCVWVWSWNWVFGIIPSLCWALDSHPRYHLQALRHLYVLAAEPRLLTPVDVDSNTPCYALIEVTYKVTWLGGPEELWDDQTLGFIPVFVGVASSLEFGFRLGGDKVNSAQISEGLGSTRSHLRCALVAPGEQKGGQGESPESSNRQGRVSWLTQVLFSLQKDFQRLRGGWKHLWFSKPSCNSEISNLAFLLGASIRCPSGKSPFCGIYFKWEKGYAQDWVLGIFRGKRCSSVVLAKTSPCSHYSLLPKPSHFSLAQRWVLIHRSMEKMAWEVCGSWHESYVYLGTEPPACSQGSCSPYSPYPLPSFSRRN